MIVRLVLGVEESQLKTNGSMVQSLKRSGFINVFLLLFKGLVAYVKPKKSRGLLLRKGTRNIPLENFEHLLFVLSNLDRTTGAIEDVSSGESVIYKQFFEERQAEIRAVIASD